MSSAKDIQTNGIHQEEPSTSGRLTSADNNANLKDTANHKGAIPKRKTTKSKTNIFSKKSLKLNNNIEEESRCLVKSEMLKLNGITNGTCSYFDQHKNNGTFVYFDECPTENLSILNNSQLHDRQLNMLDTNLVGRMNNVQLEDSVDFKENFKSDTWDCSSDDDLFSVSDDGCIYTYKGDQVADLPSSFFNLNKSPLTLPLKPNREQSSSPEMDYLEMDFDPGPSDDFLSETISIEDNADMCVKTSNVQSNSVKLDEISTNCDTKDYINTDKAKCKILEPVRESNCKKSKSKEATVTRTSKPVTVENNENAFHQLYPWFCPITQRTISSTDIANIRKCHFTKGELMSPTEKVSISDSSKICDTFLGKVEDTMIWSEEEASLMQINQIGPSACGATAVLNVLNALRLPIPSLETLNECVKTKLRSNSSLLTEYLLSRSEAGTDHNALIDGLRKLSNNQIDARFFHMYPERVVNLYTWLAFWIKNGAVPIATLNLQKCAGYIPDAWHHQMIYGVGPKGIFMTNPLECIQAEHLWPQLHSESILLIRREDILKRWNIKTDLPQLIKIRDARWRTMNVVGVYTNNKQQT